MKSRKEYEAAAKAKMEELEADIKKLRKQASHAREEFVAEHKEKLDELHALNAKTREKFDELLDASEDAWKETQKGLEQYWKALGNELKAYQGFTTKSDKKDKKSP